MMMPGRKYSNSSGYRYGFNGQEKDKEIAIEDYDFGARIYDSRTGKWLSPDPLGSVYSSLSSYNFVANNPMNLIDADGNILRDQYGNIIATSDGKTPPSERLIGGQNTNGVFVKLKTITIYTDKGNPVKAEIVTGFVRRTVDGKGRVAEKVITGKVDIDHVMVNAVTVKSNCHGYAFAEGNIIIGDGRSNILKDEYTLVGKIGTNTEENTQLEKKADIAVITISGEDAESSEESWYHTGEKQINGKWTDKDDINPSEKNKTLKDIPNYKGRLKGVELEITLFQKKTKIDRKVTVKGKPDKDNSKIKIVSQDTIDKIKKTLPVE